MGRREEGGGVRNVDTTARVLTVHNEANSARPRPMGGEEREGCAQR